MSSRNAALSYGGELSKMKNSFSLHFIISLE